MFIFVGMNACIGIYAQSRFMLVCMFYIRTHLQARKYTVIIHNCGIVGRNGSSVGGCGGGSGSGSSNSKGKSVPLQARGAQRIPGS